MRPLGDECYLCPSCKGGTVVISNDGFFQYKGADTGTEWKEDADVCRCQDCGCVFAVNEWSIPTED